MITSGSFRRCFVRLADEIGRHPEERLAIIKPDGDKEYRLITGTDYEGYCQSIITGTTLVILCVNVKELSVLLAGVQRRLELKVKRGTAEKDI